MDRAIAVVLMTAELARGRMWLCAATSPVAAAKQHQAMDERTNWCPSVSREANCDIKITPNSCPGGRHRSHQMTNGRKKSGKLALQRMRVLPILGIHKHVCLFVLISSKAFVMSVRKWVC